MNGRRRRARRIVGAEIQRRVVRVLTEGRISEPQYLSAMVDPQRVVVDSRDSGLVPKPLVDRARALVRRQKKQDRDDRFDEIWCVFDRDDHPGVKGAIQEARDLGVGVAFSNPCFELWLVLHFEDRTAHVSRREIQRRCRELGLIEGKRIPEDAMPKLKSDFPTAKGRAQRLGRMHERNGSPELSNPSATVWRLVDRLR